jgi:hypothetical protein
VGLRSRDFYNIFQGKKKEKEEVMPFYKRLRRSPSTLKACVSEEIVWEIGSAEGQSPFAGGGWGYPPASIVPQDCGTKGG